MKLKWTLPLLLVALTAAVPKAELSYGKTP